MEAVCWSEPGDECAKQLSGTGPEIMKSCRVPPASLHPEEAKVIRKIGFASPGALGGRSDAAPLPTEPCLLRARRKWQISLLYDKVQEPSRRIQVAVTRVGAVSELETNRPAVNADHRNSR
jgi:hypothetical protein